MPEWIHNRAEHLLAKNPSMSKSTAFAVDAFEGELLGDGCLCIGRRYTNACFRLQAKAEGQVLFAYDALYGLGGRPISFVRRSSGYRVTPTKMWQWVSRRSEFLTDQYRRWYLNGKKIVPADFNLTALSALHWYIGDGSLHPTQAQVVLCTDNFDDVSVRRLETQLSCRELLPKRRRTNKGHVRLALTGSCVDKFLSWIGPCPVPELSHKWLVIERKYSTKRVSDQEKTLMRYLREAGYSYQEVSARTSRNISTVHEAVNGRVRHA